MKNILISTITAATLATASFAGGNIAPVTEPAVITPVSDSGFYVGVGYVYIDGEASEDGYTADVTNNGIDFRAGYDFNKYVAVEARYAIGAKDTVTVSDGYYTENVGQGDFDTYGIFVKPQYPVTEDIGVYALLGYGNVEGSLSGTEYLDENGFQWGLGANYAVTDKVDVFLDYINVYDDDAKVDGENIDLDVYTVTIGLSYKF